MACEMAFKGQVYIFDYRQITTSLNVLNDAEKNLTRGKSPNILPRKLG